MKRAALIIGCWLLADIASAQGLPQLSPAVISRLASRTNLPPFVQKTNVITVIAQNGRLMFSTDLKHWMETNNPWIQTNTPGYGFFMASNNDQFAVTWTNVPFASGYRVLEWSDAWGGNVWLTYDVGNTNRVLAHPMGAGLHYVRAESLVTNMLDGLGNKIYPFYSPMTVLDSNGTVRITQPTVSITKTNLP